MIIATGAVNGRLPLVPIGPVYSCRWLVDVVQVYVCMCLCLFAAHIDCKTLLTAVFLAFTSIYVRTYVN